MSICLTCERDVPAAGFYASNKTKCKGCVRAAVSAHRAANIDSIRAYDRARGADAHRKLAVKARAERYRDRKPIYLERYFESFPEKRAAHLAVRKAIKNGSLVPQPCERCSTTEKVQAHHEDYSRPLDVNWLYVPHHAERHREINEERRQQQRAPMTAETATMGAA